MMSRLLPVIALIIAGGAYFGYISPTFENNIAGSKELIKSYDAALQAADQFEQKKTQLLAKQKAIPEEALKRLGLFIPNNVDNVQIILDLDGLATRSGMKLGGFNTTETTKSTTSQLEGSAATKPYDSIDLSMTASGSYAALRTFLQGVEKSLRPLDLIEFQLTDSATGVYTYQMTYRLYSLR